MPIVFLRWTATDSHLVCLVQRRAAGGPSWSTISEPLPAGPNAEWIFIDQKATPGTTYEYRIRATDDAGNINTTYQVFVLPVALV
jgi:hypothetical protein